MAAHEAGYAARTLRWIRWAAFGGVTLLIVRRLLYVILPGFLPSSAWPRDSWLAGLLTDAAFELVLLTLLVGVPFCIYWFRLRAGRTTARDLLIDCAAAASLYLTTLFLL